jgi:DNA repair exonuclease SbcCD nuclease subunit
MDKVKPTGSRRLTLLHTADIHLDNPPVAADQPPKVHRAFEAIVDCALDVNVDLVLIAGDLFDHNRVGEETVVFAQDQLRRLHCPAVILPGNHDCLQAGGIYSRHDFNAACDNVEVISDPDGQTITFPELDLRIWGRAMEVHEPGFQPLARLPVRAARPTHWHVAMAHGFFYEDFETPERSSPILASEIRETGWDYVALGHKHVMADHSQDAVTAWYPGTPMPDWPSAPPGHVLVVEFCPDRGVAVRPRQVVAAFESSV